MLSPKPSRLNTLLQMLSCYTEFRWINVHCIQHGLKPVRIRYPPYQKQMQKINCSVKTVFTFRFFIAPFVPDTASHSRLIASLQIEKHSTNSGIISHASSVTGPATLQFIVIVPLNKHFNLLEGLSQLFFFLFPPTVKEKTTYLTRYSDSAAWFGLILFLHKTHQFHLVTICSLKKTSTKHKKLKQPNAFKSFFSVQLIGLLLSREYPPTPLILI